MQKQEHNWKLFCEGNFYMYNANICIVNTILNKKNSYKDPFLGVKSAKIAENN